MLTSNTVTEIVDVLIKIAEGINNNYSFNDLENQILNKTEYNRNIVAAAYSWIVEKSLRDILEPVEEFRKGFRSFNESEISLLGSFNHHRILYLRSVGLLTDSDINKILNQLEFMNKNHDEINIDLLIISLFFETGKSDPGSRYILYSSDTIN